MLVTLLMVLFFYAGLHIGLYKLFEKAGIEGWKALVPVYSDILWCRLVGRPTTSVIWLFVPVVGFFVGVNMLVDLARSFGKYSLGQHILIGAVPFIYVPVMAWQKETVFVSAGYTEYHGWRNELREAVKAKNEYAIQELIRKYPQFKKSIVREWTEAAFFAIFAAHFIRLLFIEAFTIPTPSMEGSLLVGDFLVVSKMHYGVRLPMTPLSFPLMHNMMPFTGGESYTKLVQWGYVRLPAFQSVQRYDPVVFNFPEGDTVFGGFVEFDDQYHNKLKMGADRATLLKDERLVYRPIDKRDHYIKRCVGLPGDKIEVRAGLLFVNDAPAEEVAGVQYMHRIYSQVNLNVKYIEEELGGTFLRERQTNRINPAIVFMSAATADKVRKINGVDSVARMLEPAGERGMSIFPYNAELYKWNIDNYGPITIPKAGTPIALSMENIDLYKRIIAAYEGNELEIKEGQIYINGQVATSFTPRMDYYWMMGDNRNQSADSRSWGFVPEDHIVGKPLFVAFSKRDAARGGGVRWNRMFMGASGK